jgi:hypothetical protein
MKRAKWWELYMALKDSYCPVGTAASTFVEKTYIACTFRDTGISSFRQGYNVIEL